ncbi:MAG TPA: 50S ribosomal protein L11 methyltransferase, partial [Caldithrix abyssi]|nr:50S ribosomal protein L11 methyltransferase [Caldithrix abyssi]
QQLTVTALEEQDWNRAWKAYFKPERVTRRLVVCPPWEKYRPAKNERVLIINPKMAFGTGHHETTKLLLMFLEEFNPRGKTVLDIGTGSGILSIYAVMLGATDALGVDVEPAAVENAHENAELNGVSQRTDFLVGELNRVPARRYPLILANINRRVLENLAAPLKDYIEPQGVLLLSGLLVKDLPVIERHYQQQGWRVVSRKRLGEWQALALTGRE